MDRGLFLSRADWTTRFPPRFDFRLVGKAPSRWAPNYRLTFSRALALSVRRADPKALGLGAFRSVLPGPCRGSRPECGCMTAREEARSGLVCPDPPRWPEKEPSSRLNSRTARLSPHRDTPNPCLNRSGGSHFLFRRKWHQFRDFMPNGIFDQFCVRLLRGLPNPVAMLLGQVVEEMHVVERVVSRVGHWLLP